MNKKFLVKVNDFEGPFDRVLELIEKKKITINEISLSRITDEYILFLKDNELRLGDKTKFIWVASVLLLLKSKSLLPKLVFDKEDEKDIGELKKRLKILKIFRIAGIGIRGHWRNKIAYKRRQKKNIEIKFRPHQDITFKNILISLDELLIRNQKKEKIPKKTVERQKSLKEITEEIITKVERYIRLTFSELVLTKDKKESSASFISILELFRNGFVDLNQKEDFGEILIEKKEPTEVLYKE